jgi:hypothetical protein
MLGSPNSCYASSISSLSNKEPTYVVLASDSEHISVYFCTCARYAQSRCSSHSAVQLVGLFIDHHYREPSWTAQQPQRPLRLTDLLPHHTPLCHHAGHSHVCAFFFWLSLPIVTVPLLFGVSAGAPQHLLNGHSSEYRAQWKCTTCRYGGLQVHRYRRK